MSEVVFQFPSSIIRAYTGNVVRGTAVVYHDPANPGTECQPFPDGSYERIMRGACERIPSQQRSIIATFDHKSSNLLGRTPTTLKLIAREHGLDFELTLPETTLGRDIGHLITRGDLQGVSFTATPGYSTISHEGNKRIINIRSFKPEQFLEVGLVAMPAYTAAQIARSMSWQEEAQELWRKTQAMHSQIEKLQP